MTDRYCIYSNGTQNFHFSAQDLTSCCSTNGLGCWGGNAWDAWRYWRDTGIVSGGNYNSSQGCRPYEIASCDHNLESKLPPCTEPVYTPKCEKFCESSYNIDYDNDKRRGKTIYGVWPEEDIKAELFKNGPVEAVFDVYEDFINYKTGVYKHTGEDERLGGHAVKMLGWGVENGQKYWLVANSWNAEWGDQGYFKIIRGENNCDIESGIIGGEPIIE